MKSFWFWVRILVDVLGVLTLLLILYMLYQMLSYRLRDDHSEPVSQPERSWQLMNIGLGEAEDWQLQGNWEQQRCEGSEVQYLVRYRHLKLHSITVAQDKAWQRADDNVVLNALLTKLRHSSCLELVSDKDMAARLPRLWFRVREARWWDGRLHNWTVYIYDPVRDQVMIWQDAFPA